MKLEQRQDYQDYNRRNNIRITEIQEKPDETREETANSLETLRRKASSQPMKIERAPSFQARCAFSSPSLNCSGSTREL
ncbi:hypothetical protein E2C01_049533 [Portunus trituberculatus]|uniref:Uncharacterized protein n=1 Tax=Portunus trituberculatus TaxID=210409 RepID=A0A5B7G9Q0_PORTR|nr:hypothetical protein [Portunus trituberculatus]